MKLSKWAKIQGIGYLTAYRWFKSGRLPVKGYQTASGTIIVQEETLATTNGKTVIYFRVSSYSKKTDLENQLRRCEDFCIANGWVISKSYKEIASGMNDQRKQLWKMLGSGPTRIVVENRDRLTRFGFAYLEKLLKEKGCEIIVINSSDTDTQDLMKDFISVITSFCCRLYGLRRAQNKIKGIKTIIKNDTNQ